MEKELKTTDDSYFIMKWGKFAALIAGIILATNTVSVFMISSQYEDTKAKHHNQEVEDDKVYNEARDKRRLARTLKDAKVYIDMKFLNAEILDLKKELKECKN